MEEGLGVSLTSMNRVSIERSNWHVLAVEAFRRFGNILFSTIASLEGTTDNTCCQLPGTADILIWPWNIIIHDGCSMPKILQIIQALVGAPSSIPWTYVHKPSGKRRTTLRFRYSLRSVAVAYNLQGLAVRMLHCRR